MDMNPDRYAVYAVFLYSIDTVARVPVKHV